MGDPAPHITNDPLAIDGLEDVFAQDSPNEQWQETGLVQDQTEDSSSSVQDGTVRLVHPITVDEAARILNISENAVCKRLRKGTLQGKKSPGKFKDEWLVEGAGLIEVLNVDFSKVQDSPSETLHNTTTVQTQTEDGSSSVQDSSDSSMSRLLDLVEKQAAKLEAASGQIGYLQAQLESQASLVAAKEAQITKLLTDNQHKRAWWHRFGAWFLGFKQDER